MGKLRGGWRLWAALALLGCAEEEGSGSKMLVVPTPDQGARVDAFQVDPGDAEADAAAPDPDQGVVPDPDRGVVPDPDVGVAPDPDQGVEPLEGAVATITVIQQPEDGQIEVAVTRFVEPMPGQGDCQVVAVDPNDPPPNAAQLEAGPIEVAGVQGGPYTFELRGGAYQADRAVPTTLFAEGDVVQAAAAGALPFDLSVPAPAEVAVLSPGAFEAVSGDLEVRWNRGNAEAVLINIIPVGVGFEPARGQWVFCGSADTGSFVIPGGQVDRARVPGVPGLPNALVAVTRIRTVSEAVGTSQAILTATTSNGVAVVLE